VPNRAGGGDFAMDSEGYGGLDGPSNLSNAVQVNEPKNLIWTRVMANIRLLNPDYEYLFFGR
jgi:hypothetical protein